MFLKPPGAQKLMERGCSPDNLWPREDYNEFLQQVRNRADPIEHGSAHSMLNKSVQGNMRLAEHMLQQATR
eukprot:6629358-Pyramimonas_sp.AAC.2